MGVDEHPHNMGDDDQPVPLFLVKELDGGQLHAFLPMFRANDYGMIWFEVRGPIGLHEKLAKWRFSDRRLVERGLVCWRLK